MRYSSPVYVSSNVLKNELAVGLVVIMLLALAEFVGVTQPIRAVTEKSLRPLQHVSASIVNVIQQPFAYIHTLQTAQRRIQDLEYRYAEASALLGQIDELKAENQALREMLNASDIKLEKRIITVPIVSYGRPLIAGGAQDGVRPGQMVLVAQTLVGLVTNVSDDQAEVGLLSQETTQPVLAHTEGGVQGLVIGDGRRVLLTELPIDSTVTVGDRVVTDGQEGISRDIFIGRVAEVQAQPSSSTKTAVIEQIVSFYETNILEIR